MSVSGSLAPLDDSLVLDDSLGPERFFAVYGGMDEIPSIKKAAERAAHKLVEQKADLSRVDELPLDLHAKQGSVYIIKVAR